MNYRLLGKTNINVSEIGFGCGPTAGLMVKGTKEERKYIIEKAIDYGINYFDTAAGYGNGLSENFLGEALCNVKKDLVVASKVNLLTPDLLDISKAITRSIEGSLSRLGINCIDVLQLHNRIVEKRLSMDNIGIGPVVTIDEVLGENGVLETFKKLKSQGKIRAFGFTTYGGDIQSIKKVIDTGEFDMINAVYNMVNPSAGNLVPDRFRGSNYSQVIDLAAEKGMGVSVIRVLAGGYLVHGMKRHPISKKPKKHGMEAILDEERSEIIRKTIEKNEGRISQAAIRFALMKQEVSTVIIGFSAYEHLLEAVKCSGYKLKNETLNYLQSFYQTDFGYLAGEKI